MPIIPLVVARSGRALTCLALVLAPCLLQAAEAASPAAALRPKALLIGIDGCRFDALRAARTPHLDRLLEAGVFADNAQILGERYQKNDTVSGPGWSSILTGVWADKHGVHDNSFRGTNYQEHPPLFVSFKQARPRARAVSFVTWPPIHEKIVAQADVSRSFVRGADGKDYPAADIDCTEAVVKELQQQDPDLIFFYLGQVDEIGHQHGFHPSVPQYIQAIERADALVGRVLGAVDQRSTRPSEDWLVVVTSDHGGQGTGHGGGHAIPEILNSFLIVSGAAAERGQFRETTYIVDAPVTVLAHLGIRHDPRWDGRPRGLKSN